MGDSGVTHSPLCPPHTHTRSCLAFDKWWDARSSPTKLPSPQTEALPVATARWVMGWGLEGAWVVCQLHWFSCVTRASPQPKPDTMEA